MYERYKSRKNCYRALVSLTGGAGGFSLSSKSDIVTVDDLFVMKKEKINTLKHLHSPTLLCVRSLGSS